MRKGAIWHDGSPVTPDDVVWSLQRAATRRAAIPIQFVWAKVGNYKVDGKTITADVQGVRADAVQMDGVPHRLRPAESLLRESRRRRLREGADRLAAPTRSTRSSATRSCG